MNGIVLLGIDFGSGGCKVTAIDGTGVILGEASVEYTTHYEHQGWSEQDPDDWYPAMCEALAKVRNKGVDFSAIKAVSFDGSTHNAVLMDENMKPIRRTIMWTDQRSVKECIYLKENHLDTIFRTAYQMPSPTWTLPQMMWLKNNEPEILKKTKHILFVKDYVRYLVTGLAATDYIEAQGHSGTVEDIHLFYTYIVTPDNKLVLLPNGALSNDSIVNYSAKPLRRLDLTFAISYNEDFERAEKVLQEICRNNEKILEDPKPLIKVSAHADSSINIVVKVWVNNSDYWEVNYAMLEEVKRRFDEEKIEIPYNQLDVHVIAPKE